MIKIIDGTVRLEDVTEPDVVFLFGKYFS